MGVVIREPDFLHRMETTAGNAALSQMVAEELQLQYARKLGVMPRESEVIARYKKLSEQANFGAYLASTQQGPEDVMRSIRVQMAQSAIVNKGITISDEDARAYYARQTDKKNPAAKFYTPPTVTIEIITTKTRDKAEQAAAELAKGTPFGQVAQKYSEDSSKSNGGVLPPVQLGRTFASKMGVVEPTIFGLQVGQQVGPKQMAGSWWVIHCLDKKPEIIKSFEDVKNECQEGALLQKSLPARSKQVHDDYVAFQKSANIRAFWPQYKNVIGGR